MSEDKTQKIESGEMTRSQAEVRFREDVMRVGGVSHADWQNDYRDNPDNYDSDGSLKPRPKPTSSDKWIAAHGGATTVDIAHTDFVDLPEDRQEETLASSEIAVEGVQREAFYGQYVRIFEDEGEAGLKAAMAGDKIHRGWLDRNGGQTWVTDEQRRPFDELSQAEKDKDLVFQDAAVEATLDRIMHREFQVPDRLLMRWAREDADALIAKQGVGAVVGEMHQTREGWVHVKLAISADGESLDGEYPLETIATYLHDKLTISHGESVASAAERYSNQSARVVGGAALGSTPGR